MESTCQYVAEGIITNEKTIRKYVQILNVLFEHAIDLGWRDDNPAKGVRALKGGKKAPHIPWTPDAMQHWRENAGELELQIFEIGL